MRLIQLKLMALMVYTAGLKNDEWKWKSNMNKWIKPF